MSKATKALKAVCETLKEGMNSDSLDRVAEIGSTLNYWEATAILLRMRRKGFHPWAYRALFYKPGKLKR